METVYKKIQTKAQLERGKIRKRNCTNVWLQSISRNYEGELNIIDKRLGLAAATLGESEAISDSCDDWVFTEKRESRRDGLPCPDETSKDNFDDFFSTQSPPRLESFSESESESESEEEEDDSEDSSPIHVQHKHRDENTINHNANKVNLAFGYPISNERFSPASRSAMEIYTFFRGCAFRKSRHRLLGWTIEVGINKRKALEIFL